MYIVFSGFVLTLAVVVAMAVVHTKNLFAAVMLTGIFSLLMATNFFLLDAIDVALTEAAVGAGIATVLALSALALVTDREAPKPGRHYAMLPVSVAAAILGYLMLAAPEIGSASAPVQKHLANFYIRQTEDTIHIPNVITAVLGSFRGYDTFGETTVILTAAMGVLMLLGRPSANLRANLRANDRPRTTLHEHTIPQVIGRFFIPLIVLYGLYVQFHGEYSPGGGFQAGTIVAAGVILFSLLEGEGRALQVLPEYVLAGMMSFGVLLYGGVGVVCMLRGGNFLDYSYLAEHGGYHLGLTLIELGVGITVSGVLLTIYHCFAARRS
jgi:multicomponent Na+:H+ antiporter subunit B